MKPLEQLAREAGGVMMYAGDEEQDAEFNMTTSDLARFRAACRAEALEEAAQVCERVGVQLCESYGDGAECIRTGEECAAAIREMK